MRVSMVARMEATVIDGSPASDLEARMRDFWPNGIVTRNGDVVTGELTEEIDLAD